MARHVEAAADACRAGRKEPLDFSNVCGFSDLVGSGVRSGRHRGDSVIRQRCAYGTADRCQRDTDLPVS